MTEDRITRQARELGEELIERQAASKFTVRQKILIEGYFNLRQNSGLKHETPRFEGREWKAVGKTMVRNGADGSRLLVYQIENDLEVCIVESNGTQKSFAQPMAAP
jgi:hypothetical protein